MIKYQDTPGLSQEQEDFKTIHSQNQSKIIFESYDIISEVVYELSDDNFNLLLDFFGLNDDSVEEKYSGFISEIDVSLVNDKHIQDFQRHIKLSCHQREYMLKQSKEAKKLAEDASKVKNKIYSEFIAILGIFTAISFSMMGSVQALSNLFSSVDSTTEEIGYAFIAGGIYIIVLAIVIYIMFYGMKKIIDDESEFKFSKSLTIIIFIISLLFISIGFIIWCKLN